MLLTGLRMRTASSPVISKAHSKPCLHQRKTILRKNTGVPLPPYFGHLYVTKQKENGLKTVKCDNLAHCLIPKHTFNAFKQMLLLHAFYHL